MNISNNLNFQNYGILKVKGDIDWKKWDVVFMTVCKQISIPLYICMHAIFFIENTPAAQWI